MADLAATTRIDITARDLTGQTFSALEEKLSGLAKHAAAFVGVATFGSLAKSAIDAADAVNRLVEQTGIAAADIDRLTIVASLNGVEANGLVKAYKALAGAMNESQDPMSKQAAVFKALGINTKDAQGNLRGMQDVIADIAKVFADAKDGPEKMAVAIALFQKGAMDMLPVLKNYAEDMERARKVQQAFGEINTETAKAGDDFNDSITLMGEGMRRVFLPAVDELGPAMVRFSTAMTSVGKEGSALTPVLNVIFKDILPAAVETIGAIILATNSLAKVLGNTVGGLAAASAMAAGGNFKGAWSTMGEVFDDNARIIAESNKQIAVLMDRSKQASPALNTLADSTSKVNAAARAMAGGAKAAGDSLKGWAQGMGDIADALNKEDAARNKAAKGQAEQLALIDKLWEAQQKQVDTIDNETEGYKKQLNALTMTKEQITALEIAKLQAIVDARLYEGYLNAETDAMLRQLEVMKRLQGAQSSKDASEAAKKMADEYERAADSIASSLTDALMRGFESGKDIAKNFIDTLKNWFKTLVLQPVIKFAVQGGMNALGLGALTGAGGGGTGAGGLSGLSSLFNLGGGSGASGLAGGISSLFGGSSFTAGLAGDAFMPAMAGSADSIIAGLGSALSAVPVAGWMVLGGALLSGILSGLKHGGPKEGGFASLSGVAGLNVDSDNQRYYTPNQNDAVLQKTVQTMSDSFTEGLRLLGGKAGKVNFGLGYDTDPKGTANNRISAGASINGVSVYDARNIDTGNRDESTLNTQLALQAKRAVFAALQASELPTRIAELFKGLDPNAMGADAIDNIIAFGNAMQGVVEAASGSIVEDAAKAITATNASIVDNLAELGRQLTTTASRTTGTTESMQQLGIATTNYRQAVLQALVAINQIKQAMGTMFAGVRDQIESAGLSNQEMYNRYQMKADTGMASLATTTDPAKVQQIGEQISNWMIAAFQLLDPAAQLANKDKFLSAVDTVAEAVNTRLNEISGGITAASESPLASVTTALDKAMEQFNRAANTTNSAADKLDGAADKIAKAIDSLTINVGGSDYSPVGA